MKIKKIATVIGCALMVGATMGAASAASYPEQILNKNVAVVLGTDGADATDQGVATAIEANLNGAATGLTTSTTVTGGESFMLDKSSDHFNFNDVLSGISGLADLGDDELDFLADGTYDDGDIDEDYDQKITLDNKALTLFAENEYENDEPTVGFFFDNGNGVLDYTLEFDSGINLTDMIATDMPLLGNEYYVLDADEGTGKITLLDSADTTLLAEGETVTVGGKSVTIAYIEDGEVKLTVDGETTDTMVEGNTEELEDESFVAVTDILWASKDAGTSKVEFSIGAGKIILENGSDVIFGEDSDDEIDGLTSTVVLTNGLLDSITIDWASDDETFLTEGDSITMPGFGVISLEFDGLNVPSESETITVSNGDTLTLEMGNYEIPLMWMSTTIQALGEEDYVLDITNASTDYAAAGYANASVMWWETGAKVNTTELSDGLSVAEDNRFVVTRIDTDLSDIETLYYEVSDISADKSTAILTLDDQIGTDDLVFDSVGDTDDHGDVTVTLDGFDSTNTTAYLSFAAGADVMTYNKVVSELGMVITLPASAANTTDIVFQEADEDGDLNAGAVTITANVDQSTDDKLYVTFDGTNTAQQETLSDNVYTAIVNSALASRIETDEPTGSDEENEFSIVYYGEEVTADVSVVVGGTVSSDNGEISAVVVNDDANTAGKNLVVVGGNCVNAVARELLELDGGDGCLAAFEAAEGVGNGEFLIESFDHEGSVALLVAGYSALDTTKAKDALLADSDLDVAAGMKYVPASATDMTLTAM